MRDYGTAKWEGGSAECDHSPADTPTRRGIASSTLGGGKETTGHQQEGYGPQCPRCGAVRIDAQIGLEPTPAAYVASIVAVMRECWRVLKDDGVLWLNLGDSYNTSPAGNTTWGNGVGSNKHYQNEKIHQTQRKDYSGLKQKDLCGIPWRVAFALQDAGWYLRQDIIWSKPNPMPESVTDRCTKAHEYIFLLTKSARYFYDAEAIKEPNQYDPSSGWAKQRNAGINTNLYKAQRYPGRGGDDGFNDATHDAADLSGRNRRSVWTVATQPYSGSHFATFPPKLVEPMILAGTSQRGECPHCGKAWVRVVEKTGITPETERTKRLGEIQRERNLVGGGGKPGPGFGRGAGGDAPLPEVVTLGWRQQCDCPPHEPIPQTVLDPFAGSGTVGKVAIAHGRRAVLLDLNLKYIDLQFERTSNTQIGLAL